MIDTTYPRGTARFRACWRKRGKADDLPERFIGRTQSGLRTKLHAVADAKGCPLKFVMTAGQVIDYSNAAALVGSLPTVEWMIADRGTAPTGSGTG